MARNLQANTLIGDYTDGDNLFPIIRTTLAAELSTVGITGVGLPNIHILGINGVTNAALSLKLSTFTKMAAMPYNGTTYYSFDAGTYIDNINVPISEITLITDTPSASANIRLNYFYEPIR